MITAAEYKAAEMEVMRRDARHGWRVHLAVYMVVNAAMVFVSVIVMHALWFIIPVVGWTVPLTLHYLHAVRWFDRETQELQGRIDYFAQWMQRTA